MNKQIFIEKIAALGCEIVPTYWIDTRSDYDGEYMYIRLTKDNRMLYENGSFEHHKYNGRKFSANGNGWYGASDEVDMYDKAYEFIKQAVELSNKPIEKYVYTDLL